MIGAVQNSAELGRIVRIPRRVWAPEVAASWAERWTAALGRPARTGCHADECPCRGSGSMALRPIQGVALSEIAALRGALLPIRVGGGKTLISLLAARAVDAKRPLLLLPAHLIEKTRAEMRALRRHWNLPAFLRIESYQSLGRVNGATLLDNYAPDLIVADEGHYLKNPSAAVTKRVARYIRARRKAGDPFAFVCMSGTITKRSIRDFAHLASWALGSGSPAPADFDVLDEWSRALDVDVSPPRRLTPGALAALRTDPREDLRHAYRRRLVDSPGVVATQEGPLPIGLRIRSHLVEVGPEVSIAFERLRREWTTPDEWPVEDGVAIWRHARELATGFYSRWNPRPPDDWRDARREWASICRHILGSNRRHLDSELQVRLAVQEGHYPEAARALADWLAIEPSFTPNAEAVWIDDRALTWIANWSKVQGPALIWTDRPAVGARLSSLTGLPYYANLGVDSRGRSIERHDPREGSAILSIEANKEGRNLQAWSRNLIMDVPPNGAKWEQLLGRTHRDGQTAEEVTADVMIGCIEDAEAIWRAVEDSRYAEEITGQAQKLVHADLEDVIELESLRRQSGAQWNKRP